MNNKLFSKTKFAHDVNGEIAKCYWVCINIRKGCKAKIHYEVDLDVAGPGHDGMTDKIINGAATDHDDEYCITDEMDIAVRNARNNVLREATAGKFNTVFHCKKVVFLICIIFGVDLNVAYANMMNPIQLDNPVAAGQMFTADSLHSAYSRRRLSVLPRLPIGYNDVIIPEEYRRAENGHQFLLL